MGSILRISSTEFGKDVGRFEDLALSQPIVLTRDGRDRTVMISAAEYERLKRRDRHVVATAQLPSELMDAVRRTEMDQRHAHLDELLDDWHP